MEFFQVYLRVQFPLILAIACIAAAPPVWAQTARHPLSTLPSMQSRTQQPEEAFGLATRPGPQSEIDAYLLPDQNPVRLSAELEKRAELPSEVRQSGSDVHWEVESGDLHVTHESGHRAEALWYPPLRSQVAEVKAVAEVGVESREGGTRPVRLERRLKFISPVSSLMVIGGMLDGYEIGQYLDPYDPTVAQRYTVESNWYELHPERYLPPEYFYRVDQESRNLRISPHLTLGHFIIDFEWGSLGLPQYIALDLNLVRKIEDLIGLMNRDGYRVSTITPIYGFRPPTFNLGTIVGNPEGNLKVPFSMHQYGRAIDFIVDEDGDLVMDDLNRDGIADMHDAAVVMHYVNILDRQYRAEGRWEMVGGAGLYDRHDFVGRIATPYIHVDTRGFQSERDTLIRWPNRWPDGTPIMWGDI